MGISRRILLLTSILCLTVTFGLTLLSAPAAADLDSVKAEIEAGRYETAIPALRKLAINGDVPAMVLIGDLHIAGKGSIRNPALAFDWYEKAAKEKNADGQYKLGLLYLNGDGVPRYIGKAKELLIEAAEQGHAKAAYQLGIIHSQVHGGAKPNRKMAIEWFTKASELGSIEAELSLQEVLQAGVNIEKVPEGDFLSEAEGIPATEEERITHNTKKWITSLNKHLTGLQIYPRGVISVTKKNDQSYSVKIPGFRIVQPNGNLGISSKLEIIVSPEGELDAALGDYPTYKFTASLPKTVLFRPKSEEEEDVYVTMEPKILEGRWLTPLETFEAMELTIDNLKIRDAEEDKTVNIKQIHVTSNIEKQEASLWRGKPLGIKISGISATTKEKGLLFDLDQFGVDANFDGFDIDTWNKLMKSAASDPMVSFREIQKISNQRKNLSPSSVVPSGGIAGEKLQLNLNGLRIYHLGNKAAVDVVPSLSIGDIIFSIGVDKLDKYRATAGLIISGKDIAGGQSKDLDQYQKLVPDNVSVDINLEQLPLWQLAGLLVSDVMNNPTAWVQDAHASCSFRKNAEASSGIDVKI